MARRCRTKPSRIGPDGIVEHPLGIEVFQGAGLPCCHRRNAASRTSLAAGMTTFSVRTTFCKLRLNSRTASKTSSLTCRFALSRCNSDLEDVDLGPADVALVAVEKGHGRRHAQRPRGRALNAQERVVLIGVGLPEQVNVGITVGLAELHVGMGTLHGQPHRQHVRPRLIGPLQELFA